MVKLYDGGVYLVNGTEIVPEAAAPAHYNKEEAKKGTIAYSILKAHNTSGNMEQLKIKFDALTSHDITFVGIIQTARASGMEKFPIPYVLTNCHNSLCAVGGTINEDDHVFGLSAARKTELPDYGVAVTELPRLEIDGTAVSASTVRRALAAGDWQTVQKLTPETTWRYLQEVYR